MWETLLIHHEVCNFTREPAKVPELKQQQFWSSFFGILWAPKQNEWSNGWSGWFVVVVFRIEILSDSDQGWTRLNHSSHQEKSWTVKENWRFQKYNSPWKLWFRRFQIHLALCDSPMNCWGKHASFALICFSPIPDPRVVAYHLFQQIFWLNQLISQN